MIYSHAGNILQMWHLDKQFSFIGFARCAALERAHKDGVMTGAAILY